MEIKKGAFPKDETFRIAPHRDSDSNLAYPGPKSTDGLGYKLKSYDELSGIGKETTGTGAPNGKVPDTIRGMIFKRLSFPQSFSLPAGRRESSSSWTPD